MRIAYVSHLLEPTGGDHILLSHAIGLRKLGHTVDLYFSGRLKLDSGGQEDSTSRSAAAAEPVTYYVDDGYLNKLDFSGHDLVVANGLYGAKKVLALARCAKKVWFCQNFDPYIFGFSDEVDQVYRGFQDYLLYSSTLQKIIRHYYGERNFVACNNGVEYDDLIPFRKKGFLGSKRICFMTAYYRPYKGIGLANEIFCEMRRRGFVTVEINATAGPLGGTMEYHRNPSFAEKCSLLAGCDVSIHPSVFETWNLVSMESMALGTPVVGVDSGGITEYADASNSVILGRRDAAAVCDAIEGLCRNKKEYLRLQRNGIATAFKHSWDMVMPQIERSYEKLVGL